MQTNEVKCRTSLSWSERIGAEKEEEKEEEEQRQRAEQQKDEQEKNKEEDEDNCLCIDEERNWTEGKRNGMTWREQKERGNGKYSKEMQCHQRHSSSLHGSI